MDKFNNKVFNSNVFEKYLKTLPSTKENSLINSSLFKVVNKYKSMASEQAGGFYFTEPIKGRIGGNAQNYDGVTNIKSNSRNTFYQGKIIIGRDNAWGEDDFSSEVTGTTFEPEAGEIKEYWDGEYQKLALSMLKGIFSMTKGNNFVEKHTYRTNDILGADTCNKASQKALGDKKKNLGVIYMHSVVSTQLEGLQLISFFKYTVDGIEKDLTIGSYNGKTVIVDDDMPTKEISATYKASADTTVDATKKYFTKSGNVYTLVENPTGNPSTSSYYEMLTNGYTEYTTYMFKNGFFEFEDISAKVPSEIQRDAMLNGGHTDLVSRKRIALVPDLISFVKGNVVTSSPTNAELENGANWDVVNDGKVGTPEYIDDKLINLVRIISRG